MQSYTYSQEWYRKALQKFPFIQALEPLEGETSQSFYDAIVEEHITLKTIAAIKKKNGGQLARDEREREVTAIEKATSAVSKQYRRASIKIHPDRFGNQYMKEFEELQQANNVLRVPKHRHEYLEGFWGICDLFYQKRQKGEKISSENEELFLASRHRDWLKLNAEKFHAEMPSNRKPETQHRPLQILGGMSTHIPRQIGVRTVHPNSRTVLLSIPVLQPTHEFYACCSEIYVVVVDGAEEKTLKKLRGNAIDKEACKEHLDVEVVLPDHGIFYVAWYATLSFDTEQGTASRVTPRSYEVRIDCFLQKHINLVEKKPVLLRHARQTTGDLRSTLAHLTHTTGLAIDELERRYWILHHAVSKARHLEQRVIELHGLLGEKHSHELLALSEVLDSASKPKAALEEAMEGKRAKNELKTFKIYVAAKIESGTATSWMKMVTEAQLGKLHGNSNRLYQFFVDGNRAKALGVGADTLDAAAQREDFFTPKQCDKLREVRDEVEREFAAESEAIRKQQEEEKRQVELRKQMAEKAKEMPWGSIVRLFGLKTQPALNGEVGTYIGLTDQGRYRVELFSQNRVVSLTGENICLIHEYEEKVKQHSASNSSSGGTTALDDQTLQDPPGRMAVPAVDNSYLYSNENPPPPSPPPQQPEQPLHPKPVSPSLSTAASASTDSSVIERTIFVPNEQIGQLYGLKGSNLRHLKSVIGLTKVVVGKEAVNGRREVQLFGDRKSVDEAEAFCAKELSISSTSSSASTILSTPSAKLKKKPAPVPVETNSPTERADNTPLVKFRRRDLAHAVISHRLRKRGYINKRPVSQLTIQVSSDRKLEKLIGPQCKGLKHIVDTTGLDMIVVYKHTGNDGLKGIQFTGPPNAVLKASKLCASSTNCSRSPRKESDMISLSHLIRPDGDWVEACATPSIESTVLVPSQSVGWLIGKQGRTLSRIADTSVGIEMINVSKFSYSGWQEVQVVGNSVGVQHAESECSRILQTMVQHELSTVSTPSPIATPKQAGSILKTMDIPREVCGEVIGKHGAHLHEMKRITGVDYINVDPKVIDGSRKVRIKGPEASVAKVVALVEEFCAAKLGAMSDAEPAAVAPASTSSPTGVDKAKMTIPAVPNAIKSPGPANVAAPIGILGPNVIPPGSHGENSVTVATQNGVVGSSGVSAWKPSPSDIAHSISPDGTASLEPDALLNFLRDQSSCLKSSAEKFFYWLQSEDINTIDELMEAIEDDDFVRTEMQSNGLKVRFGRYDGTCCTVCNALLIFSFRIRLRTVGLQKSCIFKGHRLCREDAEESFEA